MREPTLTANLFVKPVQPRIGPPETFVRPRQMVERAFAAAASDAGVDVEWKHQGWPMPKEGSRLPAEAQYKALTTRRYDADVNVLLLHSLDDVGPEVGHLLLRQKRALHTFLVSLTDLPDRMLSRDTYRGLTALPAPGTGEHLDLSEFRDADAEVFKAKNPEQDGYMSFHDITHLSTQKLYTMFALARVRKED